MQERQFLRAPLSAREIALYYLEWHVRSKIGVSEIQSFLLLQYVYISFRIEQDNAKL